MLPRPGSHRKMTPMNDTHRTHSFGLTLLSLTAAVLAASPAHGQSATTEKGRVVEAPDNITNFAPAEDEMSVDAATVNLRQVLEDLGPVATTWYQHVTTLADPFFEGRVPTSRGMEVAGDYVAFYFRGYGLEPAFPEGDDDAWTSYFQPFDFGVRDGPTVATVENPHLAVNGQDVAYANDFVIFGNSGSGKASGPVTFVGYGIAEGEDGYSSFDAGADLSGRIALVLRYEPLDDAGASRWSDDGFSRHSSLRRKLRTIEELGAEAILIVNPPGAALGREGLDSLERSSRFGRSMDIPVAQITTALADDLLIQADPKSRDLLTLRRLADRGEITTVDLSGDYTITVAADVKRDVRQRSVPGRNVGGVLRGHGEFADQWLIIGGHYDHVGIGELRGVMPGNRGQLHPGADDNASGTAAVMTLAKLMAEEYDKAPSDADLRSVLFLAFDAEEQGLHGSRHYADHPTMPYEKITAMLNFDMIGRLRNNNVMILGARTAEGLEELLTEHVESSGLTASLAPASSGRSDEANFIRREIPGLHFFTGMHPEYTTPEDTSFTINPGGAARVIDLGLGLAMELVTRADMLTYAEPGRARTQSRGYADVRLGIRPGMGADLETGILVEGVALDTSAADAGIQEGDILLSWDGRELTDMGALMECLQKHKPGDVVKMEIRRGEETVVLDVKLKASDQD